LSSKPGSEIKVRKKKISITVAMEIKGCRFLEEEIHQKDNE